MDFRKVPEKHRFMVAVSCLDEKMLDWYAIALGKEEQTQHWSEFKDILLRHYRARNLKQGKDRLANIRQASSIQDYLLEFNEALAECPGL